MFYFQLFKLLFIQQMFDTIMGSHSHYDPRLHSTILYVLCGRFMFVLKYQYEDRKGIKFDTSSFKRIRNMREADM